MEDTLHYEIIGDTTQPALLLVHGMLSSNYQWEDNKDFLAQHFQLIMVEIWGHGNSPTPSDESAYTASNYCKQLEAIREKLGIEQWAAIGQSFGAGVTMNYAIAHPDRVTKLVVTNSKLAMGEMAKNMTFPKGPLPPLRTLPIHPIHSKRFAPDLKEKLVAVADAVDKEAVRKGMTQRNTLCCRERLSEISCPTLLCQGIYEKQFREPAEYAKTQIQNIRVVEMEAGHNPNRDAAEHFNQEVLNFLKPTYNEQNMKKVRPAATIMLCRDNQGKLEVLLLKRNNALVFGGVWVFPGGKVEPEEIAQGKDDLEAATLAAVRETKEETDVDITMNELFFFRHWTTPLVEPRRFSTWFFYGELPANSNEVKIDDSEIKEHLWLHPQAAIDKMKAGELVMMPPTIMSLQLIRKCQTVTEARQKMEPLEPIFILPVLQQKGSNMICLFEGDAGYESGEADTKGARHRLSLNMKTSDFEFEYQGCGNAHPVNEGMHL